jgi:hypothetical protein
MSPSIQSRGHAALTERLANFGGNGSEWDESTGATGGKVLLNWWAVLESNQRPMD